MRRQADGSVLYAVYGTLRQGWGNNRLLQADGVEFLGETRTPADYTLYSLGGFPGVAEGGETEVVVEIFKVTNEDVIKRVNRLEGYTGNRGDANNWYDTCDVETEWGIANMFIMNELSSSARYPVIKSGDWNNAK